MTRPASEKVVAEALRMVGEAERAFTSRWHLTTLRRIDDGLHDLLQEQRDLFNGAIFNGSDADVREQAGATVRGWAAAIKRLEAPLQPDDSYFIGRCMKTGTRVVISDQISSLPRAQVINDHGFNNPAILMTPDEVAALIGGLEVINSIKSVFPDSEIVEINHGSH